MNHASRKTQDMVKLALFSGIIVVLAMTPLGYVPLGVIRATTIHIPVILGSILLGWKAGAFLGGLFGLTSLVINTMTPNLAYQGVKRLIKSDVVALGAAGFLGSMTNTVLVMNMIYLFFGDSWGAAKNIAPDMVYKTILAVIATNGVPEAIVAMLVTAAVGKVLLALKRKDG